MIDAETIERWENGLAAVFEAQMMVDRLNFENEMAAREASPPEQPVPDEVKRSELDLFCRGLEMSLASTHFYAAAMES